MTEPLFTFHCLFHCSVLRATRSHSSPNWLLRIGSIEPHSTAGIGSKLLLVPLANYLFLLGGSSCSSSEETNSDLHATAVLGMSKEGEKKSLNSGRVFLTHDSKEQDLLVCVSRAAFFFFPLRNVSKGVKMKLLTRIQLGASFQSLCCFTYFSRKSLYN